jgi:hypothetical protein
MNDMPGNGLLKGLGVTLKRFIDTYLDDLKWLGRRYHTDEGIAHRSGKDGRGIFTVQYPEEKIPVPVRMVKESCVVHPAVYALGSVRPNASGSSEPLIRPLVAPFPIQLSFILILTSV